MHIIFFFEIKYIFKIGKQSNIPSYQHVYVTPKGQSNLVVNMKPYNHYFYFIKKEETIELNSVLGRTRTISRSDFLLNPRSG